MEALVSSEGQVHAYVNDQDYSIKPTIQAVSSRIIVICFLNLWGVLREDYIFGMSKPLLTGSQNSVALAIEFFPHFVSVVQDHSRS